MQFPFPRSVGSVVQQIATNGRRHLVAESMGLSSMRKGEGSLDILPENGDTEAPLEVFGTLPDGTTGWGTKIDGAVVNFRNWAGQQLSDLADRITVEKNRNDSQDNTLASHNTRITNAQTTASGAVTVNNSQNDRLSSLESSIGGISTNTQIIVALGEALATLRDRVVVLEWRANAGNLPVWTNP